MIKKLLIATTLCLVSAHSANAFTYAEAGDSGELLTTAQVIDLTNAISSGTDPALTSITGNIGVINDSGADVFGIFLTSGISFTASVSSGVITNDDSQLFLFDSQGFGLIANDNANLISNGSSITLTPTTSGVYYIAISGFNYDPQDGQANFIFPDVRPGQLAPNPGAGALAGWAARSAGATATYNYNITLTGAAPVPEPVMGGGFLAFAGLGIASVFRRKRNLAQ